MQINDIDCRKYPGSEKVYIEGEIHPDIRVAMRRVDLMPTVGKDGTRRENGSVFIYDTSGPYTDPAVEIDINAGLPRLRESWNARRADLEQLPEITSEYGRKRLEMKELDAIRFPKHHKPLRAKKGAEIT